MRNFENLQISSDKIILLAEYTVKNKSTVRNTAKEFDLSKTTVYVYLTKILPEIVPENELYQEVLKTLAYNKAQRAKRGWLAMSRKLKQSEDETK